MSLLPPVLLEEAAEQQGGGRGMGHRGEGLEGGHRSCEGAAEPAQGPRPAAGQGVVPTARH
eukprot:7796539-Lingulodinium_polyedra.AAC.1